MSPKIKKPCRAIQQVSKGGGFAAAYISDGHTTLTVFCTKDEGHISPHHFNTKVEL